jgi:hypothetical protein
MAGVSAVSLAVGAAAGYLFAQKQLEQKYIDIAEKEIEDAKVYFKTLKKGEGFETPEAAAQTLGRPTSRRPLHPPVGVLDEVVEDLKYRTRVLVEEEVDETEDEVPNTPHVISLQEHLRNETFSKVSLTYYSVDDVLVDENEMPIEDVEATVGQDNLDKFGHRSKDPRIVYVRNEKLEIDYEIIRHDGSFGELVHGVGTEDKQPTRKFRRREY